MNETENEKISPNIAIDEFLARLQSLSMKADVFFGKIENVFQKPYNHELALSGFNLTVCQVHRVLNICILIGDLLQLESELNTFENMAKANLHLYLYSFAEENNLGKLSNEIGTLLDSLLKEKDRLQENIVTASRLLSKIKS